MEKLSNIFTIGYGNGFELNRLSENSEGINFVSRTAKNNGISAKVEKLIDVNPFQAGLITVSLGGSVLESFLQTSNFYTGYHIFCLNPKIELSEKQKLFYCLCIRANKYRYSYGRQANKTLGDILIPSINEIPNWINNIIVPNIPSKNTVINERIIYNTNNWRWFQYSDIFNIIKGKRLTKDNQVGGSIAYVSSSSFNNGIDNYINEHTDENCLTFACYGSIGEVFYQNKKVWVSDNANVFYLKNIELNKYIAMFLIPILKLEQFRFSYGMTGKKERLQNLKIKLPVNKNGKPDFEFMENYIKSLPYSSSI
jgi:hypothetical protein